MMVVKNDVISREGEVIDWRRSVGGNEMRSSLSQHRFQFRAVASEPFQNFVKDCRYRAGRRPTGCLLHPISIADVVGNFRRPGRQVRDQRERGAGTSGA